jgi:DsbC/DsbD-like thiol-disulfide interchange protein
LVHSSAEREQSVPTPLIVVVIATSLALLPSTLFTVRAAATSQNGASRPSYRLDTPAKAVLVASDVRAQIALSKASAFGGQRLGVVVYFDIAPGWHVYGKPLPEEYTPTTLTFDTDLLSGQKLDFPKPKPVKFELLGETLPVYQGHFEAAGNIVLRPKLAPGEHLLGGTLSFQECNDNLCKVPQQLRFEIPLRIDSQLPAAPG